MDRTIPQGDDQTNDSTFDLDGDHTGPTEATPTAARQPNRARNPAMIGGTTFTSFYRAFKPQLTDYAAGKKADDPEGTADLALFDLHRALRRGSFETTAAARAYAYRAVRSRVAGEFRKSIPVPVPFDEEDLADRAGDESQAVVDRDAATRLLAGLNDSQREVVEARYFDGLTAEEVGQRTDRSPEAVYQLQRRGLANLRRVAPTILLLVLIIGGGLVLLALTRESSTVTTDPIDEPVERPADGSDNSDDSSGVGQSGLGIVTEDGVIVAETGPGQPIDDGVGLDAPESEFGPAPVEDDLGGPVTTLEPATTTSPPTTVPGPGAARQTVPDLVPETSTTALATTLAPFDWLIEPRNVARLRFEHSGLCLDAPGDSIGAVVIQRPCQVGGTQDIELVPRGNGNAARVVHSRLCLGPQGNALVQGAVIVQQECTGEPWQVFEIPGGALKFWDEDLCYAVEDDSTAEGARLVLARCTEGPTQRFSGA